MGKTRSRIGVGVWRFLSDSEWSRSAFFVNLLESQWSRSLLSNYKIESKNERKCDFDITIGFTNFENFREAVESEYDIRKICGVGLESELNFSEQKWSRSQK